MSLERKEIFEFGQFRLDVNEHAIERIDGVRNGTLTEKAFQVLVLLVRRRGHLVTKDELIGYVWPNTIVEDNNLEKCVHHVRQFLGKTSEGTHYIETVRKHGYRFVGRVNVVEVSGTWLPETFRLPDEDRTSRATREGAEAADSVLSLEVANDSAKNAQSVGMSMTAVIACVAVGVVAIAALVGYLSFVRAGEAGRPGSIVVLPFAPINTADRNVLFEIGIADSLINRLASAEGLTVRSLNSVRRYADAPTDPVSAGLEQKVDYVLAANYQVAGGKIKVTAQLYNVTSGKVEGTFNSEQDLTNVFAAQGAIAADFGNQLLARFGIKPGKALAKRGTDNAEAYRLYQQGMYLLDKRSPTNSKKGLDYLEQAVKLDPNYAQAWAAKAIGLRTGSFGLRNQTELHSESIEAVNRALAIEPDLSDAYTALCLNRFQYDYDFAGAEAACKRAVELDPNSSMAHRVTASLLSFRARHDEAIAEYKVAMDLEPASYLNKQVFSTGLYLARRYEEASTQFQRLIDLDPTGYVPYNGMIRTLEAEGSEAEAFEWFIKLLTARNKDPEIIRLYTSVYHDSGWRGVLLERANDPDGGLGNGNNFFIACLYARAGERDKAFEHLEVSFQQREAALPQLQTQPQLDPIRDDPRFADLIGRIGLPTG